MEDLWKSLIHLYSLKKTFFIDSINKTVNFTFEYDEGIIKSIKSSDYNARFNPELKQWILPINSYSKSRILEIVKEYGFKQKAVEIVDDVVVDYERSEVDYAYLKGLCDAKDFTYQPRNYQLEALGYAREKTNILNGDDVGLGKTFESIMYAETSNSFPCLVIVPASVKDQWKKVWLEITKNKRSVSTIESSPKKSNPNNWDADVVIINYDIIGKKQGKGTTVRFQELIDQEWAMTIFDEAHFMKDKKAQRSAAAKAITKPDNMIIQLLTGTAVMSRPVEVWNLLKILKRDHLIAKDWYQFIRRYCGGYRGKFGWVTDGATNTLELNRRLREVCYLRREKKDVLKELPLAIKQIISVPITNQRAIDRATHDFISYVRETQGDEKAEKAMEAEHLVALGALRKLAIEGKLKGLEQYLKDWKLSGGGKLVIYGIHREPLEYLSNKFKSPLIAGGISSSKKHQIKEDWIASDEMFLFANIESGGTGLDGLQHICSNMLIIELPWRPSDLTQVIGRLERSGQTIPPSINYMLNFGTIDSEMWQMLEDKEQVTEAVNKGIDVKRNNSGMKAVMKKILKRTI